MTVTIIRSVVSAELQIRIAVVIQMHQVNGCTVLYRMSRCILLPVSNTSNDIRDSYNKEAAMAEFETEGMVLFMMLFIK